MVVCDTPRNMPISIERDWPRSLADINLTPRGPVYPSPAHWRDEVLYFLLPDRFCDNDWQRRPLFDRNAPQRHTASDRRAWARAGRGFCGGTLRGIRQQLGYLGGLGVTALWIGPIWRQRPDLDTYHGYGIQNFVDVDPRFGTRQDLRDLVDEAHERGIRVLLDIIYNHSGDNFFYRGNDGSPQSMMSYRFSPPYDVHGWHSATGTSVPTIGNEGDGVWPRELQDFSWYTRAGAIGQWDPRPGEDIGNPDIEFRRGDFFGLKDVNTQRAEVLTALVRIYQYWIALTDCDGFRVDAVKHVSYEASRNFCGAIHEYTESIGKENFLLIGEVSGGDRFEREYLDVFGRNIDAVLDIGDPAARIEGVAKGFAPARTFFELFDPPAILGSHREVGQYHVSILDDHDRVGRSKARFGTGNVSAVGYVQTASAVGMQLTTLGIPCIYYGTEQTFDGSEWDHVPSSDDDGFIDRYIRECMFGGPFGSFRTTGCHFFDPSHPAYIRIGAVARLRNRRDAIGLALRRGRQYLRGLRYALGTPFHPQEAGEIAAWTRVLHTTAVEVAINTRGTASVHAHVEVDPRLHGSELRVLYDSGWPDDVFQRAVPPEERRLPITMDAHGASVELELAPGGMVILA